eukprot:TRINITY_DN5837_c0_g1_i1.p1 TRINITY_DN5837_c0_g1~~TRINITY_DN5837_c0_g1_i1.p1  ORF type:complete len:298 (+),score=70.70 TRINITY_DN5837_c0_g1_i1:46-894(+)
MRSVSVGGKKTLLITALVVSLFFITFFLGRLGSSPNGLVDPPQANREVLSHNPSDSEKRWIETISWSPRVFVYHNMISKEDAAYVVQLATPKVERSTVVGRDGKPAVDNARTSSGVFVMGEWAKDPIFAKIEDIIAQWTHLPPENGEAFYVLRYDVGERYVPHTDFFNANDPAQQQHQIGPSGNRVATVVTCLQSPDEGGETYFPVIDKMVPCRTGSAVLFWDTTPNFEVDPRSQHGGNPVLAGQKWAMTKWIRPRPFRMKRDASSEIGELLQADEEDQSEQ